MTEWTIWTHPLSLVAQWTVMGALFGVWLAGRKLGDYSEQRDRLKRSIADKHTRELALGDHATIRLAAWFYGARKWGLRGFIVGCMVAIVSIFVPFD